MRECGVGIGGFEQIRAAIAHPAPRRPAADDHGARFALRQILLITRIAEKSNLPGPGLIDRRHIVDRDRAISQNPSADMTG